ncbi:M28 family peptidase [Winogradskyella endarachnes]|uniref:M28 family peptidase n=1 Tax=Winogradskyella endarachnes TaxID=2681965 RepID=A0A6L6UBW4_9FLAO|nr:M20/M25/M40 family metallo-hydrolase [Winogradskyella endarachnes]MUU78397.1 M28 family peptidase [Winogradskyella endarachnes]
MKKLLIFSCTALLILGCGSSTKNKTNTLPEKAVVADPTEYASTITSEELKTMLYTYASDEFEGRNTGEKGQKMAVEYLKEKYKEMGISTPLGGDDYFQEVPLEKQQVSEAQLTVNGVKYENFKNQIVLDASKSITISTDQIIYVGYGIDDEHYSDYNTIDVTNKIVLAKAGEPKDKQGNFITSGTTEKTKWTNGRQSLASKKEAAIKNGAKGILYFDNESFARYAPYYKRQAQSGSTGRLKLKSNEDNILMLMINDELAKALYPSILEDSSAKQIKTELNIEVENKTESIMSENVVAYIKGSEQPDEILVISAHLDHEGIKDGKIYNGADDDGSGTVAILEIAQAFKAAEKAGHGPKRTILFLHVTGEEKGLLGSKHYADNDPIFALEKTVANLNIDMIGRTDPKRTIGTRNYIYLIGSDKLSTDLHNISEEINTKYTQLELDYKFNDDNDPNRFYYRSDHYNFAKNNIPVIFYFNGTHDDYHQPSDTPDKIEYDLLETRSRLIFYTAWEVANRAERLVVDKVSNK